jgi:hypothetical protein
VYQLFVIFVGIHLPAVYDYPDLKSALADFEVVRDAMQLGKIVKLMTDARMPAALIATHYVVSVYVLPKEK